MVLPGIERLPEKDSLANADDDNLQLMILITLPFFVLVDFGCSLWLTGKGAPNLATYQIKLLVAWPACC